MKKILILFISLLFIPKINALSNLKIDNTSLSPVFDKKIHLYNYYTDKDIIKISLEKDSTEEVKGYGIFNIKDGINTFKITSSKYGEYKINVFKNYSEKNLSYDLLDLQIENYEINFSNDIKEYTIDINNETNLNIDYELTRDDAIVKITGNGNFNSSNNVIKIEIYNSDKLEKEYKINVNKTIQVSASKQINKIKELTPVQNVLLILVLSIFSITLMILSYKIIFNKKIKLNILHNILHK